jgi:deoxyribodipyrimidine photo-lyase
VSAAPVIVWFDRDLRLADNPALSAAAATGRPVVPVFIWSPEEEAPWAPGAASRWWLHRSLTSLSAALAARGSTLIVRNGPVAAALAALAAETGADRVFWNRRYEPAAIARDRTVEAELARRGIGAAIYAGNVLFEPGTVLNRSGRPFQVFTPFWRACLAAPPPAEPEPAPARLPASREWPASLAIADMRLEPEVDWAGGLREAWTPGEAAAVRAAEQFVEASMASYAVRRDLPAEPGTSRLSPYLHFGEISARQVWHRARLARGAEPYLRQLAWREFSYHFLFHFPHTPQEPFRSEFRAFPWRSDAHLFQAWTRGRTGYPLVDAGMRELWHTGWMHNRVRMLAASFLVKHLLVPWREGAAWFWDTLVDADLANNTMGWQWTAGCGPDAAPYFRIFNPTLQAAKFDPAGEYVRRWVPELSRGDYPRPIVTHEEGRERAMASLASMNRLR